MCKGSRGTTRLMRHLKDTVKKGPQAMHSRTAYPGMVCVPGRQTDSQTDRQECIPLSPSLHAASPSPPPSCSAALTAAAAAAAWMHTHAQAPFCVHPKTGKVCVPIDPSAAWNFDLDAVPTVQQLAEELTAAGSSTAQQQVCAAQQSEIITKSSRVISPCLHNHHHHHDHHHHHHHHNLPPPPPSHVLPVS